MSDNHHFSTTSKSSSTTTSTESSSTLTFTTASTLTVPSSTKVTASPSSPIDKFSPSSSDILNSDDDNGWQDMPVMHMDELRGTLTTLTTSTASSSDIWDSDDDDGWQDTPMVHTDNEDPPVPKHITLDMRYTLPTNHLCTTPVPGLSSSASAPTSPSPGEGVGGTGGDTEGGLQKSESAVENQVDCLCNRRIELLGLATLGGGLVIGLSAGLLVPIIGVSLGTVFSTIGLARASACLAASAGAAVITTGNVLTGAGIMGKATFSLTHFPSSTSTARGAFQ
ncbi:hypothetical protein F5877DRAFT_84303 [Lentinula edodes]|nr:hypothetical protein F5877DRAFT_84303 [Lentinula edodes]